MGEVLVRGCDAIKLTRSFAECTRDYAEKHFWRFARSLGNGRGVNPSECASAASPRTSVRTRRSSVSA